MTSKIWSKKVRVKRRLKTICQRMDLKGERPVRSKTLCHTARHRLTSTTISSLEPRLSSMVSMVHSDSLGSTSTIQLLQRQSRNRERMPSSMQKDSSICGPTRFGRKIPRHILQWVSRLQIQTRKSNPLPDTLTPIPFIPHMRTLLMSPTGGIMMCGD